jgi:arylsulfatase A-like enzyme
VHDARRCLLEDDIDTLAERFQRAGYTTAAFAANLLISRSNRFNQGFETFVLLPGVTARGLNRHVEHWLEQTDGLARLLYVHYLDPHRRTRRPRPFPRPACSAEAR